MGPRKKVTEQTVGRITPGPLSCPRRGRPGLREPGRGQEGPGLRHCFPVPGSTGLAGCGAGQAYVCRSGNSCRPPGAPAQPGVGARESQPAAAYALEIRDALPAKGPGRRWRCLHTPGPRTPRAGSAGMGSFCARLPPFVCGCGGPEAWAPWGPSGGRSGFSREGLLTEGHQAAAGEGPEVAGSRAGWDVRGPRGIRLCVQDACRAARVGPSQPLGVRNQLQPLHQHVGPSRGWPR